MSKKEFVLVSQGIEIMRTKCQETAIITIKKGNDEWFEYKQKCEDNNEQYANNYIELFIEDEYTKKIKQENNRLKKIYREDIAIFHDENQDLLNKTEELEQENEKLKDLVSSIKEDFLKSNNEIAELQQDKEELINYIDDRIQELDTLLLDSQNNNDREMCYLPSQYSTKIEVYKEILSKLKGDDKE